jgi:hypothetical protein
MALADVAHGPPRTAGTCPEPRGRTLYALSFDEERNTFHPKACASNANGHASPFRGGDGPLLRIATASTQSAPRLATACSLLNRFWCEAFGPS